MVDMFLFCLYSKLDGFNKFTIPFLVIPSPTLGSVELVRVMINSAMAFTCLYLLSLFRYGFPVYDTFSEIVFTEAFQESWNFINESKCHTCLH